MNGAVFQGINPEAAADCMPWSAARADAVCAQQGAERFSTGRKFYRRRQRLFGALRTDFTPLQQIVDENSYGSVGGVSALRQKFRREGRRARLAGRCLPAFVLPPSLSL
jgi:hypothetical protein